MSKRQHSSLSSASDDEIQPKVYKVSENKLAELITKVDQVIEAQTKMERKFSKLANAVSRLTEEIIVLKKEQKRRIAQPLVAEKVLPSKPFEEDFLEFESKLRESEFFDQVVREMSSFGGKGPQDFIRKQWRRIMRDSVAKRICWTGNSKQHKQAAKYLIFIAAIRSAFQICYPSCSLTLVEEISKKIFQYAADRIAKKKDVA